MSKFKDQTENTPPSSLGGNTEVKVQPSKPLVETDNTQPSTQTLKMQSPNTSSSDKSGLTTVLQHSTTPPTVDQILLHSKLVRISLGILLRAGLVKRYEVREKETQKVLKVRYEFDMSQWSERLELK